MKKISIMLIAALAAVSAQATTITFDEPGHVHGGNVGGINGWVESYGVKTYNSLNIGGRGHLVYNDSGKAYKDVSGDVANITTVSFLLRSYNSNHAYPFDTGWCFWHNLTHVEISSNPAGVSASLF